MTATTNQVLKFVTSHMEQEKGRSPSYREIMKACHIGSTSVVNYHLNILAEQGQIEIVPGVARSIRLPGYEYVKVDQR
jgi:SOS-response transcriptional repressor LexA